MSCFLYSLLVFLIILLLLTIVHCRIQPVSETKEKQFKLWKELILQYHMLNNNYICIPENFEYFENKSIGRKLSSKDIGLVMEFLVNQGNAEWEDGAKSRCRIIWKTPEVMAGEIYTWASKNGHLDNIFTIFELVSGDEHQDSGFFGTDQAQFRKALQVLQRSNKAVIIEGSTSDEDGVKFL
jgi:ESCRT-II complex subunit VPS25